METQEKPVYSLKRFRNKTEYVTAAKWHITCLKLFIAEFFEIEKNIFLHKSSTRYMDVKNPRQIAMWLRAVSNIEEIGETGTMGDKENAANFSYIAKYDWPDYDRTTIYWAYEQTETRRQFDKTFKRKTDFILNEWKLYDRKTWNEFNR